MRAAEYISNLAERGRHHFTTEEAARALGVSMVAIRAALRRLKQKSRIAAPLRGFHVIVPPEYRKLGCLPADQFVPQLMHHLGLEYYVGLLSAASYHGAAHQQPMVYQVVVARNRPDIVCGSVRVRFIARKNVSEMGTRRVNTPRGYVAVSIPEATAFDLVGYADHCGGLSNVATVLSELVEVLKQAKLAGIAGLSPMPWSQRLGYLLELVGAKDKTEKLFDYVDANVNETALLAPSGRKVSGRRDNRWRLVINRKVEPD